MRSTSSPPTLTGDGVTLRAYRPEDEDGVLDQCRDPLTQRWTTVPVPYERRHAGEFLAAVRRGWTDGTAFGFAVEAEGRFAGGVRLRRDGEAGVSVGFALAPWARGHGLAARALVPLLTWAFDALEPEVALWSSIAGNWASRRTAWAVGFRVEGTVRGLAEQRGIRLDGWIGSIRRGDPLVPVHPWYDPPVVSGDGVSLRPARSEDLSAMTQACNDPLTQRWLSQLPRPYTREDARAHLEEIAEEQAAGRALFWALADPACDRLLGEIALWGMAQGESRSGELGYWAHPAARGRGLTSAGVRLAARHGLRPRDQGGIGLHRLVIRVAADNVPSQRVAEHAGFRPAGRDRSAQFLRDGTPVDLLRYDLLRGELE